MAFASSAQIIHLSQPTPSSLRPFQPEGDVILLVNDFQVTWEWTLCYLAGGFLQRFLGIFHPGKMGEMIPSWRLHIFQMGWVETTN